MTDNYTQRRSMKKFISKILCYIISIQLCTGCINSSQLYVEGSDSFDISGLIAQSFQNVGDVIFPSAMAATKTGEVKVYTVDADNEMLEIASYDLFDNAKKFKFKVSKDLVNESVIYFDYNAVGDTDRREKLEVTPYGAKSVYTVLNAETTFKSDILQEVIADAIVADPALGLEGIKGIVRNYRAQEYEAAVQAIGGYTTYVNTFSSSIPTTNIARIIIANKAETSVSVLAEEFRPELLAAAYAKVAGAKLDCLTSSLPTVENSSSAAYDSSLYFSTTDAATEKALGGKTQTLQDVSGERSGNYYISKFIDKLIGLARQAFSALKGSIGLMDRTNNVLTTCNVAITSGTTPTSGTAPLSGGDI